MEIRKPNLSSAAVILKKRMASAGVKVTHAEALEHAAAMEGYQSYQAYQAHQSAIADWEKPILLLEHPEQCGRDYRFVGERNEGVWIRMRNISVKLNQTDEGVVVDMYASGAEDQDSSASTYHFFNEAAGEQLELAEELDDMRKHIKELLDREKVLVAPDPDAPGMWYWVQGNTFSASCFVSEWAATEAAFESVF